MHTTRDHMSDQPTVAQIQKVFHTSDMVRRCVPVLRHWRHTYNDNGIERPTMRGMDGPEGYFYWRITLVRLMKDGSLKPYQVTCTGHAFGDCRYGKAIQREQYFYGYTSMAKHRRATEEEKQDPHFWDHDYVEPERRAINGPAPSTPLLHKVWE